MSTPKQVLNVGDVFVLKADARVYEVTKRIEGKGLIIHNYFDPKETSFIDFGSDMMLLQDLVEFLNLKKAVKV